ncbi:MAG TPA: SPOR domain-containing protein [Nevskiaceae bacterium]|nr:SPOR domain-containing protein [Nevskiaceae bacterium]
MHLGAWLAGLSLMGTLLLHPRPGLAAALPLSVLREAGTVQIERAGRVLPVARGQTLAAGDVLATAAESRAGLSFATLSRLTLGDHSRLQIHSAEPPRGGRGALLRARLLAGAVLVDGRPRNELPVQDLRLNVGALRLRIYGAEVWAEQGERVATVCLISGAVEIQGPLGSQRLDLPEDCLVAGAEGAPFTVRADATLTRKRLRTAFAEEAAALAGPGWTLLAARTAEAGAAETLAARLRAEGLPAEAIADPQGGYRVGLGRYASAAAAEAYRRKLLQSRPQLALEVVAE